MSRILVAFLAFASLCCAQTLPAFRWISEVDGSGSDQLAGLGTDAQGNIYLAGTTFSPGFRVQAAVQDHLAGGSDIFVTKLDPAGNIVYSTYFGGSGADTASAVTVDSSGNVYVTGTTTSTDFPTTPGVYASSVPTPAGASGFGDRIVSFLLKLRPDGAVGYATYFSNSWSSPNAIAVDSAGFVSLTGVSFGGMVTTDGAWRTTCPCVPSAPPFGFSVNDGFLTRFDPTGSRLVFSTYLGTQVMPNALALAPDGSSYVAGATTQVGGTSVFLFNATGTSLMASFAPPMRSQTISLSRDGTVYLAGSAVFGPAPSLITSNAFQADPGLGPNANAAPTVIMRMDGQLHGVLAGTYFGGFFGTVVKAMTLDDAGHVYLGGYTSPRSLPTRTPFVQGFGLSITGYVAELSGDLSTLLFSGPFGDNENFGVNGLAIGADGNVVLGGATSAPAQNIWVNSLELTDPPALRIDAVVGAASQFSDPISQGELIRVQGAGFTPGAQLSIGGVTVAPIFMNSTSIVAAMPSGLTGAGAVVAVSLGGSRSNNVTVSLQQ